MYEHRTFDWLWKDWRKLKTQLVRLCVRHVGLLLNSAGQYDSSRFPRFREEVLADIQGRIDEGDGSGIWRECLGLLAAFDQLQTTLQGVFRKPPKDLLPCQLLGRSLQFFLEDARRELAALETGETPARVKTWERLNRISLRLLNEQQADLSAEERCTEEHFRDIHAWIKAEYAGDYNYPQRLNNIRDFFYIFCSCCRNQSRRDPGSVPDEYALSTGGISSLSDSLFNGDAKEALLKALSQLEAEEMEILNVAFELELGAL
ncbi:MAG TPA: hypothetical protein EYP34_08570, partial [Chromatiaceae bacterium]|nr:hypothetical protein [Chromatiaceae bacterium]